jgi:hypothetical protein
MRRSAGSPERGPCDGLAVRQRVVASDVANEPTGSLLVESFLTTPWPSLFDPPRVLRRGTATALSLCYGGSGVSGVSGGAVGVVWQLDYI